MKSDDRTSNESEDRAKLLEEIRRRAEEAELKRIEEEERERQASQKGPKQPPPSQKKPLPPAERAPGPAAARTETAPSQKAPAEKPPEPQVQGAEPPPSQKAPPPAVIPGETKAPGIPPSQKAPSGTPPSQVRPSLQASQKAPSQVRPEPKLEMPPPSAPVPEAKAPFPAPFPLPSAETPPSTAKIAREERIAVLRERLTIALDRGKLQKADDLITELDKLTGNQDELEPFRIRLKEARAAKEAAKAKKAPHPPPEAPKRKEPPIEDRSQREARKKRVAELLESADNFYQQEKYQKGLEVTNEILDLEPANEEAARLREAIRKAQSLALKIQQEEVRRKAEEAEHYTPPSQEPPKPAVTDKDVWGASTAPTGDVGYELPPEEKGPVGPPKRPAVEQMVERLSKVRIPARPLVIAGSILALALIGYFVVDMWRNTVTPAKYSLLVLPATPLANDTTFTWIADGITEDLIRDFTSVNELRVIGTGTALGFRTMSITPLQFARGVGANYYLQWSILRAPEGVIVQPTFFDTSSSKPLWANRYTTSMRELPGVRLEIVHRLASAMGLKISNEEETAFQRYRVPEPDAYNLYLRARHMLRQRQQFESDEIIQTLEQAVRADTLFADAQSALGWAHVLAFEAAPQVVTAHLAQASVCVQQAIQLGARNAETFRVWGLVEAGRGQYDRALDRLEQAVSVSPTDAESQRRLAFVDGIRNRLDPALRAAQRAVSDDPGNVDSYTTLGLIQQLKGDYPAALKAYEQGLRYARDRSVYASGFYADALVYVQKPDRAVEIMNDRIARVRENPTDFYKLGRIGQSAGKPKQEWQGVFQRAKSLLEERIAADPRDAVALSYLALVNTRLGEFREALAANTKAQQVAPDNVEVLYNTARMFALQRDKAKAFDYLTKAVNTRYNLSAVLDMDFFNLHAEPEFLTAITR